MDQKIARISFFTGESTGFGTGKSGDIRLIRENSQIPKPMIRFIGGLYLLGLEDVIYMRSRAPWA